MNRAKGSGFGLGGLVVSRVGLLGLVGGWFAGAGAGDGGAVLVVSGGPGSGKSELCRQVVERFGGERLAVSVLRAGSLGGTTDARVLVEELIAFADRVDHDAVVMRVGELRHSTITVEGTASVGVGNGSTVIGAALLLSDGVDPVESFNQVVVPVLRAR